MVIHYCALGNIAGEVVGHLDRVTALVRGVVFGNSVRGVPIGCLDGLVNIVT